MSPSLIIFASDDGFQDILKVCEKIRKDNFEDWLSSNDFDGVVFPCNADVALADSDINPESSKHAWLPGVFFSNVGLDERWRFHPIYLRA
jgi:hypothetical protein